jgi:thiamine pyrophosphokinase
VVLEQSAAMASVTRPSARQSTVTARSKTALIVTVCLAQFMVILDATVTNVALPVIARDLQFSTSDLQWVVTAYTLTFGGFLLLGGARRTSSGDDACSRSAWTTTPCGAS